MYVPAWLPEYGIEVAALVDTGAAVSIINPRLWSGITPRLLRRLRRSLTCATTDISTASGEILRPMGVLKFKLAFGELGTCEVNALWVDGSNHACVLGMETLEEQNALIDIRQDGTRRLSLTAFEGKYHDAGGGQQRAAEFCTYALVERQQLCVQITNHYPSGDTYRPRRPPVVEVSTPAAPWKSSFKQLSSQPYVQGNRSVHTVRWADVQGEATRDVEGDRDRREYLTSDSRGSRARGRRAAEQADGVPGEGHFTSVSRDSRARSRAAVQAEVVPDEQSPPRGGQPVAKKQHDQSQAVGKGRSCEDCVRRNKKCPGHLPWQFMEPEAKHSLAVWFEAMCLKINSSPTGCYHGWRMKPDGDLLPPVHSAEIWKRLREREIKKSRRMKEKRQMRRERAKAAKANAQSVRTSGGVTADDVDVRNEDERVRVRTSGGVTADDEVVRVRNYVEGVRDRNVNERVRVRTNRRLGVNVIDVERDPDPSKLTAEEDLEAGEEDAEAEAEGGAVTGEAVSGAHKDQPRAEEDLQLGVNVVVAVKVESEGANGKSEERSKGRSNKVRDYVEANLDAGEPEHTRAAADAEYSTPSPQLKRSRRHCPPPPVQLNHSSAPGAGAGPLPTGTKLTKEYKAVHEAAKKLQQARHQKLPEIEEINELSLNEKCSVMRPAKTASRKLSWINVPKSKQKGVTPAAGNPPRARPTKASSAKDERRKRMEEEVAAYYLRRDGEKKREKQLAKHGLLVCDCQGDEECSVCRAERKEEDNTARLKQQVKEKRAALVAQLELERSVQRAQRDRSYFQEEGRRVVRLWRGCRRRAIPPRCEAWLPIELIGEGSHQVMACLVEGSRLHVHALRTWKMARGIVQWTGEGHTYVRVVNASEKSVPLESMEELGTWEVLDAAALAEVNALNAPAGLAELPAPKSKVEIKSSAPVGREALAANLEERSQHLTPQQKQAMRELLQEFEFAFRDQAGRTGMVQHAIDTGKQKPIRGVRYRMAHTEEQKVREIVEDMIEKQVVRPSRSPWGAAVVLVPKKDGGTRFCVDYRRLNEHTVKDVYPLPRIDATLDQLGGAKYFTTLDLTAGFWQVEMASGSAEKTAFITPMGLYEFEVMPFGLCNAPATFQRLMDSVLGHLGTEYVLVYLDDVLIFSRTFEEHLQHLRRVLGCLRDANLCVKLKKCYFAQKKTGYLGHVISGDGIEPDPDKLKAVAELMPPKNVKEVRGFLGFVGFYRRFVPEFSTLAKPLFHLTKKKSVWEWTEACTEAFNKLRQALLVQPVLTAPDFSREFTIRCDASYHGLGAVLTQGEGDERRVISYASRTLKDAETRYTATEIECLAMKWSVQHFRPYIHGTRFTLETDHVALTWLRTVQHSNARLIRTALALQDLDMHIVHKAGLTMHDADALSRLRRAKKVEDVVELCILPSCNAPVEPGTCSKRGGAKLACNPQHYQAWKQMKSERTVSKVSVSEMNAVRVGAEDSDDEDEEDLPMRVRRLIQEHPVYSKVLAVLEGDEDVDEEELSSHARKQLELLVQRDGLLYRVDQLYRGGRAVKGKTRLRLFVPEPLRKSVLFSCHDHLLSGGHMGVQRTFDKVRERYYWAGLYKDVQQWCASCRECSMRKSSRGLQLPVMTVPVPAEPWEFVSVDVMGPFVKAKSSGSKFIVVFCDHLTRYVETMALRVQDTKSLARALVERVMCRHGCPRTLLSDRGLPFLSELAYQVYRLLRVGKLDTAGYRPQTNGLVERFNQTFATMLSMFVNSRHDDWDLFLPYLTFAYNTGKHPATQESPFYLVHGREARMPLDVELMPRDQHCERDVEEYRAELVEGLQVAREFSRDSLQREQQKRERQPLPARATPVYKPGQQVMVRMEVTGSGTSKKLQLRWAGPFRVIRSIGGGNRTYGVKDNRGVERPVNVLRMKPFHKHPHPMIREQDYADHFATAGEALLTEGNRGCDTVEEENNGEQEVEIVDVERGGDIEEEHVEESGTQPTQILEGDGNESDGEGLGDPGTGEEHSGDGDGSALSHSQPRSWTPVDPQLWVPPDRSMSQSTTARSSQEQRQSSNEDLTPRELRLRGTDADGGASQLCSKCHRGKKGHVCSEEYRNTRQAVVNERRRGKDPSNTVPHFGIALRKRGEEHHTIRGVFAPYDLRVMEGEFETFEELVRRTEKRGAISSDWNDFCNVCNKQGGLTMCLGCNLVYHERCLVTRIIDGGLKRNEELVCPECVQEMRVKSQQ